VGSEYFINSQELESKVRNLLPSQGGAGAGFDLSASTQIIPIIDLTESAEGSNVRQDLQTSFSFKSVTSFAVNNTTTDLITTTGYFRVFGVMNYAGAGTGFIQITDGVSTKRLIDSFSIAGGVYAIPYDFIVLLEAGDTLQGFSNSTSVSVSGNTRQIADLSGNLTSP
jgi:hypothetical protein